MRFLITLVACCGIDQYQSSVALNSKRNDDDKSLVVGLVRENKLLGGGKMGRNSWRQPVQWRPSLCTISEEDVIKAERIQLYVKPGNKGMKNVKLSTSSYTPYGYRNEFV
ncbi:hypothetical protein Ccrd_025564 [Cynara cardunculus var. scolymus]|uniref:Uncharacterized protein n=2 Tax=Cynara cardunculus var. scolymus TaxID=59895 RepID=A0A103WLV0_CYNCS|nr:hypothetical protein Ccrd_025564 [Cynara cardunculus var. scolymus]